MRISHLKCAGLGAIALTAVFSTHLTALSQERCDEHAGNLVAEQEKLGQRLQAVGFNIRGNLIWILVNPDTQEWSIVTGPPEERGCIPISGTHWEWLE